LKKKKKEKNQHLLENNLIIARNGKAIMVPYKLFGAFIYMAQLMPCLIHVMIPLCLKKL